MRKYSPVFRIVKKLRTPSGSYTHYVYFKDKLLSNTGHYYRGIFYVDKHVDIGIGEFFHLMIDEMPEWFTFYPKEDSFYKVFKLGRIIFSENETKFELFFFERSFTSSRAEYLAFKHAAIASAQELFGKKTEIYDLADMVFIVVPLEWQGEETVGDMYRRAKQAAMLLYFETRGALDSRKN